MQKILIVEDDITLAKLLSESFSKVGAVSHVTTVEKSCELISKNFFDLAIIDRVLPDGDGLEVITFLQDVSFATKSLALSQKHQTAERIAGLEQGADDYLPKPFSLPELQLKVKKLLRTETWQAIDILTTDDMKFSPTTGEVWYGQKRIKVRKKESQILHCLVRHRNQVMSRQAIIDESWTLDEQIPSQTTLDVYIRRLRMVLQELGCHIVTKRGFGYSFID